MNYFKFLSTRQLYILGLVVPLFCTVIIGWLQWHAVTDMLKTRASGRHSREIQVALGVFRYSLSDAESCQFRYILTHNPADLDLYAKLRDEAKDQFNLLRSLASYNPYQKISINRIGALLDEKLGVTEKSIEMEKNGDHAGALGIMSAESSRTNMLAIENEVEVMQSNEAQTLWNVQNHSQHNLKVVSALSVLGMALCFAFILAILLLLRRLAELQSFVTIGALTEMIEYEGGMITIEEYLQRRHEALNTHGQAQIEAERVLALLEQRKLRTVRK